MNLRKIDQAFSYENSIQVDPRGISPVVKSIATSFSLSQVTSK